MNLVMKKITEYLESKDIRYILSDDDKRLELRFSAKNADVIPVLMNCQEEEDCEFFVYNYCKFPEEKREKMYELCSKMNKKFRWLRFFVDESDNTITIATDLLINPDSCADDVYTILAKIVRIGDFAYPEFMKTIWT